MKKKAKLFKGDNDKADNTDHISKLVVVEDKDAQGRHDASAGETAVEVVQGRVGYLSPCSAPQCAKVKPIHIGTLACMEC